MRNRLAISILPLFVATLAKAATCPEGTTWSQKWDAQELGALNLRLVDPKTTLELRFGKNGQVLATIGTVGGPIAGPVWKWKIRKDGSLRIHDEETTFYVFRKLCSSENRLVVGSGKRRLEFSILKDNGPVAPAREAPSNKPLQLTIPPP
jgi:hypothetical protein